MSDRRTFLFAAALLGACGLARAADPTAVLLRGAGTPTGTMAIQARPNGGEIDGATLFITYDPGQINDLTAGTMTAGPGWTGNFLKISATQVRVDLSRPSGVTSAGTLLTLNITHKLTGFAAATISLSSNSTISGFDSDGLPGPFFLSGQSAIFLNGKMRSLGSMSLGMLATAKGGGARMIAVPVDNSLFLVNAADTALADMPGWTGGKDMGNTASSRPAFGSIGGGLAVAIGTDSGRALVYNVADGAVLSDTVVGDSITAAPAINGLTNDVYWPVQTANGPEIVHQRIGASTSTDHLSVGAATDQITSSPAIWQGLILFGTSAAAKVFRVDATTGVLTPQSGAGVEGDDFNTSPAVVAGGNALIGTASGKVYKFNLTTGAQVGSPATFPQAAAPLSNPFFDAGTGMALFGGADGSLYSVDGSLTVTGLPTNSGALNTPVVAGTSTFLSDANGRLGRIAGAAETIDLNAGVGRAMAVTGTESGADQVVVNTTDGTLLAIPMP